MKQEVRQFSAKSEILENSAQNLLTNHFVIGADC